MTGLPSGASPVKQFWNRSALKVQNGDFEDTTLSYVLSPTKAQRLREAMWDHVLAVPTFEAWHEDEAGRWMPYRYEPTIRQRTMALLELPDAEAFGALIGFYCDGMRRGHNVIEMSAASIAKHAGLSKTVHDRVQKWIKSCGYLTVGGRVGLGSIGGVSRMMNKTSVRALTQKAIDELGLGHIVRASQQEFQRGRVTMMQNLSSGVRYVSKDMSLQRTPDEERDDRAALMKNSMDSVSDLVNSVVDRDTGELRPADERERKRYRPVEGGQNCPCRRMKGGHKELDRRVSEGDLSALRILLRNHPFMKEAYPRELVDQALGRGPPAPPLSPTEIPF